MTQSTGSLAGRNRETESANQTQAFLADEATWSAVTIELYDVQGLWGGRRVLISGTGHVVAQLVSAGMYEQRFEFTLGENEILQLLKVCIENDLVTITCDKRLGRPDEARPGIILVNAAGDRCAISKWAGVKNARFDAIYTEFLRIEALTQHRNPVYSGPFEQAYVSEGF
ncbi:MAG: hypothetical protein ACE5G0_12830 [Rhodothermales bacterium]